MTNSTTTVGTVDLTEGTAIKDLVQPCPPFSTVASVVALVIVAAAFGRAQSQPPNVLLITIDTVRADHLGAYGYAKAATPAIDRLAREGVRFADATTQAPLTGPAHAAILTGRYPARLGVRDNATTPIPPGTATLAQAFKQRGYRTGAFVGAFIVGPEYGFGQGFDVVDANFAGYDGSMKLQAQRRGGDVVAAALKWLSAPQPFFAWVHLYDAHAPYDPPAPFKARFRTSPYDGEIAYVDSCIARLVAALEQSGRLDRTLVVVVADHGESLGDHGEAEHGFFLYEPVLHIPWIMRLPAHASAGSVVKTQVRAIDVAPTIAAIAGAAMPGVDGQNVQPFLKSPPRDPSVSYAETFYPKWHFGWSELKSVRVGDWKYIDAPKPELYDMRTDADEQRNLVDARGPLAAGLSNELAKVQTTFGPAAAANAPPQVDAETLARLSSLGYVGIAAPSGSGRGADPKDMVPQLEAVRAGISRAIDALSQRQPDAAIAELTKLIATNDKSYEPHLFLGDAYEAKGQHERALGEYAAAGVLNPTSSAPALSAARVFIAAGDFARATQKIDEAARLHAAASDVSFLRGRVFEAQGDVAQALANYNAAVRANGSDSDARAHLAALAMQVRQYDTARPQFEALLKLGYRPSRMHFGLGQIAEAEGDTKQAIVEYRRALQLEPGLPPARAALARLGASSPQH